MAVVQTLFSPLRLMRGGGRKKCGEKSSPPAKVTAHNGTDKVAAAPATDYGGRDERLRGQRWRRQNHPRQRRTTRLVQRRGRRRPFSGRFVLGAAVASLGLSLVFLFAYLSVTMHHLHNEGGSGGGGGGGMRGYIGVDRLIRRQRGGVDGGGGDDALQQLKKREEGHTWKRLQNRIQRRPLLERKEPDRSEDYPLRELGRPLTAEEVGRANNSTLADPALLILAYNRPTYLKQQLVRLRDLPRRSNFAVYVSQDGNDTSAAEMIRRGPDKTKMCGDGNIGIGICPVRTSCCSKYGWCGTTESHCGAPGDRPCGEGKVGNGVCPSAEDGVCCSKHGWCGTTQSHCGDQLGGERKKDGGPTEKKQVETVADVVRSNSDFVTHLVHPRVAVPDQPGTAYLALHYKWALDQMFLVRNHSHVVIAEDDLLFAPDFLRLFEQTGHLLDVDPTLWCVSSWNDLGPHRFATDPRALRRTDYFPGLGWMLRRELWVEELSETFPTDAWDHWMRLDTVSRGRSCVYPEVSRNFNIGSGAGTTVKGGFYQKYIRHNRVAREDVVDFGDLDYLRKDNYDRMLADMIGGAVVVENPTAKEIQGWVAPPRNVSVGAGSDANANAKNGTDTTPGVVDAEDEEVVRFVPYTTETYKDVVAKPLRIIPSPRTRYRGITVLHVSPRGHLLVGDVRAVEDHDGVSSSSLIPRSLRFKVNPGFRAVPAGVGESCDDACSGQADGGGRADPGQRNSGMVEKLRCSDDHFAFVNRCSTLMKHFPCERGCWGSVIGPDVPNYVPGAGAPIDESSVTNTTKRVGANTTTTEGERGGDGNATSMSMAGYCLTTEGVPRCDASHVSTARICPCVPVTTVSVPVPAR